MHKWSDLLSSVASSIFSKQTLFSLCREEGKNEEQKYGLFRQRCSLTAEPPGQSDGTCPFIVKRVQLT